MGVEHTRFEAFAICVRGRKKELKEQVPDEIKKRLGFQLKKVQLGYKPDDFKPMPGVGKGVLEIRVQDENGGNTGRCFYIAKFEEAIWVLHSFVKKTQKTSQRNIKIGQQRLKQVQEPRTDVKE